MAFKFLTTPLFENTSKSTYFLVFTVSGADQQIFTLAKKKQFSWLSMMDIESEDYKNDRNVVLGG